MRKWKLKLLPSGIDSHAHKLPVEYTRASDRCLDAEFAIPDAVMPGHQHRLGLKRRKILFSRTSTPSPTFTIYPEGWTAQTEFDNSRHRDLLPMGSPLAEEQAYKLVRKLNRALDRVDHIDTRRCGEVCSGAGSQ